MFSRNNRDSNWLEQYLISCLAEIMTISDSRARESKITNRDCSTLVVELYPSFFALTTTILKGRVNVVNANASLIQ